MKTCSAFLFLLLTLLSWGSYGQEIGFLLDDYNVDRWYTDRDVFLERCKELGVSAEVNVAFSDAATQHAQGMAMLEAGAKVLVIVASDARTMGPLVAAAHQEGAKVIAYDRLISNAPIDYYLSYNCERVGELMAEYMLKKRPKGTYAIISGPDTDPNAALYRKGQLNVLQPAIARGNVKLVFDREVGEWTEMEGMILTDSLLEQHTAPIDVVLAANDGLASGVLFALEARGRAENVLISGQDADKAACRLIKEGKQAMSVYKPVPALARHAAELAVRLVKGEQVTLTTTIDNGYGDIPADLAEPVAVHRNNLKETVIADGHLQESDLQ